MIRTVILITALTLITGALAGNAPASFAGSLIHSDTVVASQTAPRFSSSYTRLTNCGSGMTKREEREAEKNGSDIPSKCPGPGGYFIYIYYSACASHITAIKGEESISLSTQAGNFKQNTVEWRLANGKPFAVIMRDYEFSGTDLCTTDGKVVSESLIVKGLTGYEHIDETINVKGTPNPNVKARELADKGYR